MKVVVVLVRAVAAGRPELSGAMDAIGSTHPALAVAVRTLATYGWLNCVELN